MEIITAINGQALRDFAKNLSSDGRLRISLFPETQLSPAEQASWVMKNQDKFDIVITFSSFIISDAENVKILDFHPSNSDSHPKHGDSVNKIVMRLWTSSTIGDIAAKKINDLRIRMENTDDPEVLKTLIEDAYNTVGDSIEKVLFVKTVMDKMTKIENEK